MNCPHCDKPVFELSKGRLKARTRIVVLHKSRAIEINCSSCGGAVTMGRMEEVRLEKAAQSPRFIVKR
jgi:hypothetical protein